MRFPCQQVYFIGLAVDIHIVCKIRITVHCIPIFPINLSVYFSVSIILSPTLLSFFTGYCKFCTILRNYHAFHKVVKVCGILSMRQNLLLRRYNLPEASQFHAAEQRGLSLCFSIHRQYSMNSGGQLLFCLTFYPEMRILSLVISHGHIAPRPTTASRILVQPGLPWPSSFFSKNTV